MTLSSDKKGFPRAVADQDSMEDDGTDILPDESGGGALTHQSLIQTWCDAPTEVTTRITWA